MNSCIHRNYYSLNLRIILENYHELANAFPVPTERQGIGEPWRRLLKNPRLESPVNLAPY